MSAENEIQVVAEDSYRLDRLDDLPYHLLHPELNLKPLSFFADKGLSFFFNSPDYVELPEKSSHPNYLYIVKDGKFGILYWCYEEHFLYTKNKHERIIPCEFEKIEKRIDEGMFVCYTEGKRTFYDLCGVMLK